MPPAVSIRKGLRASNELRGSLSACRKAFLGVGLVSGMINLLYLTGSFFMLQIYDRVLPSRSVQTLVGLAILAATLYAFQGILDVIRGRIIVRIGAFLDENVSGRVYDTIIRLPLKTKTAGDGLQPLRDLDQLRGFLSGGGPLALFDLPWMPVYLGICFIFHVWIGVAALVGALILVALTISTELRTRGPMKEAIGFASQRNVLAEAARRNAEVLQAMGMATRSAGRWGEANAKYMNAQRRASDVAGGLGAISKVLRMLLQSAVLGIGAYLVIQQEATAGIIIASSILTSRALAPVELAIANWKGFVAARHGWRRLSELLHKLPREDESMALPQPRAQLSVENIAVNPPGEQKVILVDIAFALKAGQGLGIIGPTASGKSSLARALVGVWHPARGKVRLDGAALEQWSAEELGRHIGYLPQDVELFAGTIAENIARFEPDANPDSIIAAAKAANVHELILRLPDGYETEIGENGQALSAGQRQRLALARALYKDPFLVVLDEPNSNLDAEGETALTQAILGIRARGGIAVVVAHRPSALAGVDIVLVMGNGRAQSFGPKDEVMRKLRQPAQLAQPPKVASSASGAAS
jgi:PrtD family type I secretion system ABC transporter